MHINEEDLALISGDFLFVNLPDDKAWISRYFDDDLYLFLVYYNTFRAFAKRVSLEQFCQSYIDHTGHRPSIESLCQVFMKIQKIGRTGDAGRKR